MNRRNRSQGPIILIGTLAIIIIALVIALAMRPKAPAQQSIVPQQPISTAQPQAEPTHAPAPTSEVTPEPVSNVNMVDARVLSRPIPEDGMLPVFFRAAYLQDKYIAITVDDMYQSENARKIIDLITDAGGRMTLFPIGENALKYPDTIRYAYEKGVEIENHTYSHNGLYGDTDQELAEHIYLQDAAIDHILGLDYSMHFLRPRGGDDRNDQRTHEYMKQMGYYGLVHWTRSGSSEDMNKLYSSIAPGNIYLFHTTDNDLERLQQFVPYAIEQGYQLVTMNEMFGYPENEVAPLTKTEDELKAVPTIAPYDEIPRDLQKGDYSYSVKKLQQRLIDLGWLDSKADGEYGKGTYTAVGYFQQAIGMKPNGQADVATQQALFASDAPHK